jgi:hypothetical protein
VTTSPHEHRPDLADHRAVLAAALAVLARDPGAAYEAAGTVTCPECAQITALQLGFKVAAWLNGELEGMSEELRQVLVGMLTETQAALDAGLN